jgi:serralysin
VEEGMTAVATYTSTGPESASTTWSLGGDDADDFTIAGGVLAFASMPDFESPADADGDNEYLVTVEADDDTYTATRNVVVTVTDVEDDAPVTDATLLDKFDANENGQIDKSEVVDAIIAFVTPGASNKPSKEDVVDLIVHFVTTPR